MLFHNTLYIVPLGKIIRKHDINLIVMRMTHKLYLSIRPDHTYQLVKLPLQSVQVCSFSGLGYWRKKTVPVSMQGDPLYVDKNGCSDLYCYLQLSPTTFNTFKWLSGYKNVKVISWISKYVCKVSG